MQLTFANFASGVDLHVALKAWTLACMPQRIYTFILMQGHVNVYCRLLNSVTS